MQLAKASKMHQHWTIRLELALNSGLTLRLEESYQIAFNEMPKRWCDVLADGGPGL